MKINLAILAFLSSLCYSCISEKKLPKKEINILFIGNSLTYYNEMPQILQKILETQNLNYKISQSTYPGISLTQHLNRKAVVIDKETKLTPLSINDTSTTVKLLKLKQWDFIVLQDGTVRLLIPEVKNLMVIAAINSFKENTKYGKPDFVLFKTWPNLDTFPKQHCYPSAIIDKSITKDMCCSPLMASKEEEAKLINIAYDTVAIATHVSTVPITDCFMEIIKLYPNINLYQDKSHPSKFGAYLNACMFFKYFTKQKARSIKYTAGIDEKIAHTIQDVVDKYYP
ncbi:MAG: DUF4886 domain-containing protein [Flavobacterium sp.]|nr:DUF4886 domain-containing protein [Flavobacterium sp.]